MLLFGFDVFAILACAVAQMAGGTIWFGFVFKNAFLREIGKTEQEIAEGPNMAPVYAIQFFGNILIAATLYWLMILTGLDSIGYGIMFALVLWFGVVVATIGPTFAWHGHSLKHFALIAGNMLVGFLLCGIILGAWPW